MGCAASLEEVNVYEGLDLEGDWEHEESTDSVSHMTRYIPVI